MIGKSSENQCPLSTLNIWLPSSSLGFKNQVTALYDQGGTCTGPRAGAGAEAEVCASTSSDQNNKELVFQSPWSLGARFRNKARLMLKGPGDLDSVWALSQVVKNAGLLQQTPNGHFTFTFTPYLKMVKMEESSSPEAMVTLIQGSSRGSSLDPHCTSRGCQYALTQTAHGSLPSPSLVRDHCPLWGQTLGKSFVGPRGHDGMAGAPTLSQLST